MDGITPLAATPASAGHSHVFLGTGHEQAERRTWWVIALCGAMMVLEIVGGLLFGSIALVADGLHMSTHAGALLLAALAYRYARRLAHDPRFTFGTGKLGDLAGFTSAIVLAMIALLIAYEAVSRLFAPVPIQFAEAIPIAVLGLAVNVASVWLLSGGGHHHHGHSHGHSHGHDQAHDAHGHDEQHRIETPDGVLTLSVFEDGVPPVFRLHPEAGRTLPAAAAVETIRPDGTRQVFAMQGRGGWLESTEAIPEPHQFNARVQAGGREYAVAFEEHAHEDGHGTAHRDNNMRAAVVHVLADAAVSVLVIIGLLLARAFGWLWMDPLAGIVGACVIASWSWGLIRDTGAILLDMVPDRRVAEGVRQAVEADGDRVADLHLWRLGPGHLGAILSVATAQARGPEFYRARLARFPALSHVTVEVQGGVTGMSNSADTSSEVGVFEWAWQGSSVRIGYDARGNGATVVLLPAFSTVSTRGEMRPLAERLAPGFRTVVPDWPGFGEGRHSRLDHGPDLHLAFLRAFLARVVGGPAMVAAAGHAAGYALALAHERPGTWTRIALLAPTWRGPLPTMMGGYRPVQDHLRAALRAPVLGHALYRLNVARPVVAAMYRRHVYADAALVTPAFMSEKARVARRRGGRFGSAAFVTGALDVVRDRSAFLALADPPPVPTLVIYGAGTPSKSLAEMEALSQVPGVAAHRLAVGSLGLYEECPDAVANALRPFLLGQAQPGSSRADGTGALGRDA